MNQDTRETLSALMDGESDELELRRALKTLPDDADAAATWRRYHLARSMMQREAGVDPRVDISAGVMARLADEPAPMVNTAPARAAAAPRASLVRGAGVAAAVSLMVITGVQYFGSTTGGGSAGDADMAAPLADSASGPGGLNTEVDASFAQTASLGSVGSGEATGSGMPMFEPTPFRLRGESRHSGLMTVSDGGLEAAPGGYGASRQVPPMADDQVQLLRTYLQQHAHGAAYSNSDSWLPLTRSSAISDALGR